MPDIITDYYNAFNRQDIDSMVNLLNDDFVHEPSQSPPRIGKELFAKFLNYMNKCYFEQVHDLVVLYNSDKTRAAAEFNLSGEYLKTDGDFIAATGQKYFLRVGAFFEIKDGKISRVSNHYNLQDWLKQVGG